MVTNKMNLTEFLLARIAEDEAAARGASQGRWKIWGMAVMADPLGTSNVDDCTDVAQTYFRDEQGKPRTWDAMHIIRWDPARVLAECEVKRKIVDEILASELQIHGEWGVGPMDENWIPGLRALAQLYANHKDYQQEWNE